MRIYRGKHWQFPYLMEHMMFSSIGDFSCKFLQPLFQYKLDCCQYLDDTNLYYSSIMLNNFFWLYLYGTFDILYSSDLFYLVISQFVGFLLLIYWLQLIVLMILCCIVLDLILLLWIYVC